MAASGKLGWVGRVISWATSLVFLSSAVMKLIGGEALAAGMAHLGLPMSLIVPLAILELSCVAILLTGYIGGAICTHLRVGDPIVTHIVLGISVWLGLYLRDSRLKALIPLRRGY